LISLEYFHIKIKTNEHINLNIQMIGVSLFRQNDYQICKNLFYFFIHA